jgi:mevalonate kinase
LDRWTGRLKHGGATADPDLSALADHLGRNKSFPAAQIERFKTTVYSGLYFESNVPQAYGVGSSGALCAALYDEFFDGKEGDKHKARNVRAALATLESFFHGTSSGMDPLVSLLNTPVLRETDTYHCLPTMRWPEGLTVFLLDSGVRRSTGNLVKEYLSRVDDHAFKTQCLRPLIQSVDHAIACLFDMQLDAFWEHLTLISHLELEYFKSMVTGSMLELWEKSLEDGDVVIKLCGAGGGGFYLGFGRNSADLRATYGEHLLINS